MSKRIALLSILLFIIIICGLGYVFRENITKYFFKPTVSNVKNADGSQMKVEVVAKGLDTPWSIAQLPDGDLLITERSGAVKRIGKTGTTYPIDGVKAVGEGGLLGVALHPNFVDNHLLYIYFTTDRTGELKNQVDQYRYVDDKLTYVRTILTAIPAAQNHDGGGIKFGPDGMLYITTGDAGVSADAQNIAGLSGKILRIEPYGSTPPDNPFKNLVWSYGHRNPQGIAWDDKGQLWSVEHGPSGSATGRDELNLIVKGGNYGWPIVSGNEKRDGMVSPVVQSGDSETWAPSGMAYLDGTLYFAGLRGQALYAAKINSDNTVSLSKFYDQKYGRLRAVTAVGDNTLLVSTSNRDGRGTPGTDDDKILKITIAK